MNSILRKELGPLSKLIKIKFYLKEGMAIRLAYTGKIK